MFTVYHLFVSHFGIPVLASVWTGTVYQILTVICSIVVQSYFVLRLHRLSGTIWLPMLLVLLTLGQIGTGLVICLRVNITRGVQSIIHPLRPLMVSWLTLEAAADLVIALSVSYFLQTRRTGVRQTDTVLRKLTIYAINTGSLTSILALVVMFAFAFYGLHFVHMMFILPLGGVYTASLLANLHSRSRLRKVLHRQGENGISIHLSRLPPRVRDKINGVAQPIEMRHSGEGAGDTQLSSADPPYLPTGIDAGQSS
ncbi:uncharacterized protein EI90DRAFT_3094141 [Cantharellus anzutake]|uniref:uncharacterized protein n=1 Tax=Cantharellus anzutake TaxID=1750568 RepID=UPI001908B4EF|nr:uncharacterized protein EI90DRAFT_3094141 [Cantharellus anzutake]KAF8312171.1 hypothetical protein EI90DRAFT_3094141 [Cantharellus anzutake]